jgi:hypothetical protein
MFFERDFETPEVVRIRRQARKEVAERIRKEQSPGGETEGKNG